jgi:signal transduction histidine kinase
MRIRAIGILKGKTGRYAVAAIVGWTTLITILLALAFHRYSSDTTEKALIEARTHLALNVEYLKWVGTRGGVYVKVTDNYKPNPYLKVSDRDIETRDGTRLTLVNSAYMTRQVFQQVRENSSPPVINRIVSEKFINPADRPDGWEAENLRLFATGLPEAYAVNDIGGKPYLRLFRPFITEKGCLRCHGFQGYKVGDIRGGVSIAIPLEPYLDGEKRLKEQSFVGHLLIWVAGVCIILLYALSLGRITERKIALQESRSRVMREMLVAISHNWRQPMNKIGLLVQGLEDGYRRGELDEDSVRLAAGEVMGQLRAMSDNISLFGRTFSDRTAGGLAGSKAGIRELFAAAEATLAEGGIGFSLDCRKDGAQADCGRVAVSVSGRDELAGIIMNIAENSKDAILGRIRDGGLQAGKGCVKADCDISKDRLTVRFADNGGGIPDGAMDRIFEPYFTTRDKSVRAGLGLFISKTLLEGMMDGTIRAESSGEWAVITMEARLDNE